MKLNVAIIDYGLGNLFSINQACEHAGLNSQITSNLRKIEESDALILPGVGAFGDAMNSLKNNNLIDSILNFVKSGKPFLGICLGMQLLFTESEEFGAHKGLNLIEGKIIRFPSLNSVGESIRIPQIQWNQIYKNTDALWKASPFYNIEEGTYMHFVHSYYAKPEIEDVILSYSEYEGVKYASSIMKNNIIGIQFHPEKSSSQGIKIYQNWANYIKNKKGQYVQ